MEPKTIVVDPFAEPTDLRLHLASVYEDYGEQAMRAGQIFEAEIWKKAADIAREFVTQRVIPL